MPSIRPIRLVRTPRMLKRNRGNIFITISLEMSIKKLVRLTAHSLRGRLRKPVFWICRLLD